MKPIQRESVNLILEFKARPLVRPVFHRLAQARGLALNVLRGRVTADDATYEIRLRGSHRCVSRALRFCRCD